MIKDILKDRQKTFLNQSLKYLRLVFNDHFTVLLLFLLGAGSFFYRNLLDQVNPQMTWLKVFMGLIFAGLVLMGQPASHLLEADKLYLLPKLGGFKDQYRSFAKQLFVGKVFILGLALFIMSPLIAATSQFLRVDFLALAILLFFWQGLRIYDQVAKRLVASDSSSVLMGGGAWLSLTAALLNNWLLSLGIFAVLVIFSVLQNRQSKDVELSYALVHLINLEQDRKQRLYRFFSLVTDVPEVESGPIKNKVVTAMINGLFPSHGNRINFLVSRLVFRQAAYFHLLIRLTIIGSLLLFFANDLYLTLIFAILFHWLILYQLLPVVKEVKSQTKFMVWLEDRKILLKGMQFFFIRLSVIIMIIFILATSLTSWRHGLVLLILELVFTIVFVYLYLPKRLRKAI